MSHSKTKKITNEYNRKVSYHNFSLSSEGIRDIELYQISHTGLFYIRIKVNLKRLIEKKYRQEVFSSEDYGAVSERFSRVMSTIAKELSELEYWTATRVDYCINIKTPYVKEYIKLFQKGNKPFNMEIPFDLSTHMDKNNTTKRTHKNGSMYYKSKSKNINFYDKQDELIKESTYNDYIKEKDIQQAENILRLEVQCKKNSTSYIKNKYLFKTKYLYEFIGIDISRTILQNAYKKTAGLGTYYKLKIARQKIKDIPRMHTSHKNDLIKVLELTNKYRSVWKAKQHYIGSRKFGDCINDLNKLNINPVTIPKTFPIDTLSSLYCEIEKQLLSIDEE